MSIKKFASTAIAAAALGAPTLSAAHAHHIDKKKNHVVEKYGFDKYDSYDDYVRGRRDRKGLRHAGNLRTPGIDRRIERQAKRIRSGRQAGDLTWNEARKLRKGLRRIVRARSYAKYDGNVTRQERRELRDMLDHNGQRIRRLRNNNKTASRHFRKFRKYVDLDY